MDFKPYVLEALKHDSWQTAREISNIAAAKAAEKKDWGAMSFLFSIFSHKLAARWQSFSLSGEIFVILAQIGEEGLVKRRPRTESPEVIEKRGGHRLYEYQLRESGFRNRNNESFQLISQT
jgi:hypothetical protein